MWKEVFESKYGTWRKSNKNGRLVHESRWWRDLREVCGKEVGENYFDENILWKIGKGDKIYFWEDR